MKKSTIIFFILLLAAAAAMGAMLWMTAKEKQEYETFVNAYRDKFFEGTTINGMDVSGKTVEEVESALEKSIDDYSLAITFRDGQTETITAEEIGYRYVSSGETAEILKEQDPDVWYKTWKANGKQAPDSEYTVSADAVYDEQKLLDAVKALPEMQEENMIAPENAHMDYQDAKYVVVPEVMGTTLDTEKVLEAAAAATVEKTPSLDVASIIGVYTDPEVTLENGGEHFQEEADELNALVSGCVTYTLPHGEERVVDGEVMKTWLVKDETGKLMKDEAEWDTHIAEFVQQMADDVYSIGATRTFAATGIGNIEVSGGNYGYEIDVVQEMTRLKEELDAGEVVTRKPVYLNWETSDVNNGFGYSYVEIDCSRQYLWIYVDGKVVLETPVVTGMMKKKMATPAGTCLLYGKEQNATLIGERKEYRTKVAYWMPFNGGVGMHDASWRGSFGGDIYLYDGSHGCINMPYDMAEAAFNIVTLDMPIVVYYSESFTLR